MLVVAIRAVEMIGEATGEMKVVTKVEIVEVVMTGVVEKKAVENA